MTYGYDDELPLHSDFNNIKIAEVLYGANLKQNELAPPAPPPPNERYYSLLNMPVPVKSETQILIYEIRALKNLLQLLINPPDTIKKVIFK